MRYCTDCGAPLKQHATHCLECGQMVAYQAEAASYLRQEQFSAPTMSPVASAQPLQPTYPAPLAYEPSIFQRWLHDMQHTSPRSNQALTFNIGNIAIQGVYFLFIGIWLSLLWIILAWLVSLTLIGLPLSGIMIQALPQVTFLSQRRIQFKPLQAPTAQSNVPFIARAVYFVCIGWWVSLLWMLLAWVAGITIIGLPLTLGMFKLTPTVTTLAHY